VNEITLHLQPGEIQTLIGLVRVEAAKWRGRIWRHPDRNTSGPPAGWQEHVDQLDALNDRLVTQLTLST